MDMSSSSVLRADKLVKAFRKRQVVNGVSFQLKQREIIGLLGPNGAGKTTSFYMVIGLVKQDSGLLFIDDENISRMPIHERARRGLNYLPQETSIFQGLTVEENVLSILEYCEPSNKRRSEICASLLNDLNLTRISDQKGYTLSGGERRRCELARALASNPKFILLDEPFAGVDPIAVKEIQELILKLQQKGLGILITDHNVRETLRITTRSYILFDGVILREGNPEELIADPVIRDKYLGENFSLS